MRPRILYLVTEDWYFWSHRLPMARAARDAGFDVSVATRCDQHADRIAAEGFEVHPMRWVRRSTHPVAVAFDVLEIARVYRRVRPDLVHHVAMKPVVLGSLAAAVTGVPRVVNALTGLGSVFLGSGTRTRLLRAALEAALRPLLGRRGSVLLLQNRDDADTLVEGGLVRRDAIRIVRGSGVDIDRFQKLPEAAGAVTFGFVGRMLADKGVLALLDAFAQVRARGVEARLLLAGSIDHENPTAVSETLLRSRVDELGAEWLGHVDDVRALWSRCHVAVLPSRREGLPKSLLEAAACGRPLIATDVPGCREVAIGGDNALLVPADDPSALAEAMCTLAADRDLRRRLGCRSRELVESDLSAEAVSRAITSLYLELMEAVP